MVDHTRLLNPTFKALTVYTYTHTVAAGLYTRRKIILDAIANSRVGVRIDEGIGT